jgi:hypothetical protein
VQELGRQERGALLDPVDLLGVDAGQLTDVGLFEDAGLQLMLQPDVEDDLRNSAVEAPLIEGEL